MGFDSMGAVLETGECSIALVRFLLLIPAFVTGGSTVFPRLERESEATRLESLVPLRELPFRGSLSRTVLLGYSRALARSLERGKGRETVSVDAISKPDLRGLRPSVIRLRAGRSSRETLGGLVLSLRGAGGGSGFVELGLTLERAK